MIAESVWDASVPPGGMVCAACGMPTESEPCAQHQPQVDYHRHASGDVVQGEAARCIDPDAGAEDVLVLTLGEYRRRLKAAWDEGWDRARARDGRGLRSDNPYREGPWSCSSSSPNRRDCAALLYDPPCARHENRAFRPERGDA
jgi:hypothetical protein